MVASGALRQIVHDEIAALAAQPLEYPSPCTRMSWTVFRGSGCGLRLLRLPHDVGENGHHLKGSPTHRMLAIVSERASGTLDTYRHEQGSADAFDRANRLDEPRARTLAYGDVVELEAWRDVAEWRPTPHCVVYASLVSPVVHHQHWVYQRDTRLPRELVSATFRLNRVQYALELLAEIGDASKAPATAALYEHPAHHIRWAAIKATLDLDETLGRALLRRALDDPHPHLARAAAAGLHALDREGS